MNYLIRNVSNRPVTIPCNTGEARHLPPNYSMEFINAEVTNNATVEKLLSRGVIRLTEQKQAKTAAASSDKSEKKTKAGK